MVSNFTWQRWVFTNREINWLWPKSIFSYVSGYFWSLFEDKLTSHYVSNLTTLPITDLLHHFTYLYTDHYLHKPYLEPLLMTYELAGLSQLYWRPCVNKTQNHTDTRPLNYQGYPMFRHFYFCNGPPKRRLALFWLCHEYTYGIRCEHARLDLLSVNHCFEMPSLKTKSFQTRVR